MTFLWFMNLCMIGRLVFILHDRPPPRRTLLLMSLPPLLGLLVLQWSVALPLLALVALLSAGLEMARRASADEQPGLRAASFVLTLAAASLVCGTLEPRFADWTTPFLQWTAQQFAGLPALSAELGNRLNLLVFYLLLTANEINQLIRVLLRGFSLVPQTESGDSDEREYNAGRVIGIAERWLILIVMVFSGEFAVIAFIMAAKSFARFKQLEEKAFAEYVLVGTLISTLATLVCAYGLSRALAGL